MTLHTSDIEFIVVHCSATPPSLSIGVKEINEWHIERGWKKIGYHYVIERTGKTEAGRALSEIGAHVYGYNKVSWGICMVGGINSDGHAEENFTAEQFSSLYALLIHLKGLAPSSEVLGHRDLSPDIDGDGIIEPWEWLKECPSFDVKQWWDGISL